MGCACPTCARALPIFELLRASVEAAARDLPHRSKYLLGVAGFMRRLLELVDQVARELDPAQGGEQQRASLDA